MPDKCDAHAPQGWLATLYFIIFIVIGALVLFTLFIGVVTTSMEEATSDMKEAQEVEAKVKAIMDGEKLSDEVVELYRTVFGARATAAPRRAAHPPPPPPRTLRAPSAAVTASATRTPRAPALVARAPRRLRREDPRRAFAGGGKAPPPRMGSHEAVPLFVLSRSFALVFSSRLSSSLRSSVRS